MIYLIQKTKMLQGTTTTSKKWEKWVQKANCVIEVKFIIDAVGCGSHLCWYIFMAINTHELCYMYQEKQIF